MSAYLTREAVASSRIEGTQASVTEVFDAAVTGASPRADVQEVRNGMECGIGVKNYNDVKEGDQIEVFETIQIERTL